MKVVVLGSGVIGVTTAYYLAEAGHEVTVVDRQSGPALETSFANAGEISPGYASPWAAPDVPKKALKWLFMKHAPLILRPAVDADMIRWLFALLRNCTASRYAENKQRMVHLAEYSLQQLQQIRTATGIAYDHGERGTLQLFRTQSQLDGIGKDVDVLRQYGVAFEVLDRAGCISAEPGLAYSTSEIAGGLRLPADETGDCFAFTEALAKLATAKGVTFRFGETVRGITRNVDVIEAVSTDTGTIEADAYVIALGSYSAPLARRLGMRLPVYPVKGYSITLPIDAPERAPVSTILDESYKIAITRLGGRIRVGGMAEISGYNSVLPSRRQRTLEHSLETLFPGAGESRNIAFWSGLRPMTPDGTPIVGATALSNLYINTGHGTLGWTMACGSGRILADLISGRSPEIDTRDLALSRYSRP